MGFAISNMQLESPAFESGAEIPRRHAGNGEDRSPPLSWRNAPAETRSFALFCHDPDAPLIGPGRYGYTHWLLYDIPASVTELTEATDEHTAGVNDAGNLGYNGPMPPEGHGVHHYFFWLLAIAEHPELPAGLTLQQLLEAVEPDVLGMNRLVGVYARL